VRFLGWRARTVCCVGRTARKSTAIPSATNHRSSLRLSGLLSRVRFSSQICFMSRKVSSISNRW